MASLLGRIASAVALGFNAQRGALFPWVPVWLGAGIAVYFHLSAEPLVWQLAAAAGLALALCPLAWVWRRGGGALLLIPALVLAGLALAGARAHLVAAPVLAQRLYGPVEGRVIEVDRSASGHLRLTLDQVILDRLPPEETPHRVRLTMLGKQGFFSPEPGQRVIATATFAPPEGPVIPGGFDFRRLAWFRGLGAIGYTQTPVLLLARHEPGELGFARLRHRLASQIRDELLGQSGAFAAAILTGDYNGLSDETYAALRASNLIHLISISGLHMVLLCGAVFLGLRLALVSVPILALTWPCQKIAAIGALVAGAFYYLLSGGAIPAERAWVMIAVVFGAVLAGRRAISMRSLALAALVVLILRPESLVDAGFQMSFAATLALVAGMEPLLRRTALWPRWARTFAGAVLASVLAGSASAPFAAAHFNRFAAYGLLANLIAAPLMGLVVMPLCVIWMLALPFGLTQPVLWLMGLGIEAVLGAGTAVAALPGAVAMVPGPAPAVLPLLVAGGLFLALWQGRARVFGAPIMVLALWLWHQSPRPDLLISANGGLVGLITEEGRALSRASGEAYAARHWLEDDGDGADQKEAGARAGISRAKGRAEIVVFGAKLLALNGKAAEMALDDACRQADLIILTRKVSRDERQRLGPCVLWDQGLLARTGSVALWRASGGFKVQTAESVAGRRLWTRKESADLPLPGQGPAQIAPNPQ